MLNNCLVLGWYFSEKHTSSLNIHHPDPGSPALPHWISVLLNWLKLGSTGHQHLNEVPFLHMTLPRSTVYVSCSYQHRSPYKCTCPVSKILIHCHVFWVNWLDFEVFPIMSGNFRYLDHPEQLDHIHEVSLFSLVLPWVTDQLITTCLNRSPVINLYLMYTLHWC